MIDNIRKVLDNAERLNPELNSFLSIEREHAEARGPQIADNARLPGLAIAVKDNICTKGLQTTCGSRILQNYRAHYDATAIRRLNDAGAIVGRLLKYEVQSSRFEVLQTYFVLRTSYFVLDLG